MKKYIAEVRLEGKITIIESEYNCKSDFCRDLRANGYKVRFISTEENFDADCEKYNARCEKNKLAKKVVYASHKDSADRLHMTVKEFRDWMKA